MDDTLTIAEVGCLEAAFARKGLTVDVHDDGWCVVKNKSDIDPDIETHAAALELAHTLYRVLLGAESEVFLALFKKAARRHEIFDAEAETLFEVVEDNHVDDDLLLDAKIRTGRRCLKRKCPMIELQPDIKERIDRAERAKRWTP